MGQPAEQISPEQLKSYGYSDDILPKTSEQRDWGVFHYITVWMGAVHNIMSYMTVAGFFALGLSVPQVFWAVMLSAVIVSAGYVLNGHSAAKYGVPFAMLLRDSFGVKGSIIPALCRGLIAGVVFFGATTVVGAQSLNVIFARIFPDYMTWGAGFDLFGLNFPTMLSYLFLWIITVALFLGGMNILSVFSKYSSPVVYIFIIGAAIWAITIAGGIGPIMEYVPAQPMENGLVFIACVSALVSNWAGPIVNISDLTQRAKSPKAPLYGLPIGMIVSYLLFAVTCIGLIVGTQIAFGEPIFNIVDAIGKIDNPFAVIVLILALNVGATGFVVFGNLLPAGLQMTALLPKWFTVKSAGIWTAVIGTLILPWKLVESTATLYLFYSFIGSMYGPIAGIMLSSFYIERRRKLNLDTIYVKPGDNGEHASGYNKVACLVMAISFLLPMSGAFLPQVAILSMLNQFAFFSGLILSFVLYTLFYKKQ
ncbi:MULTISPECIES: cytosine permease [Brevibacillus]|uniref:Allantoin permease n=1 Tax=Brevibacillus parabrevis TaxID=54914 RepID=A0A4Y3PVW2_BREPA|nr:MULTISPECIES: cytosine permease [Brevibacillus]MBU8714658.1 cytosine permease [Brevibacillus parabrevis]MDH6353176.1 allantoin permease [Brevibacillus sp. 1238]MDR5001997.1 cytosine permease [Brevibacillus parabrevis]MED2254626.1 cytosine permease [Brevibacillus parabrevis]RNB93365.1 allantoin transporter [Brevibacillus parabrevis]